MGGDSHGHGGHHHHFPKIPDWRQYKVENVPDLMNTKRALAGLGLKDHWLRNEVWRYDVKGYGTPKEHVKLFFFRGFKWGLLAAVATVLIGNALDDGHDHHHDAHHGHH